jgi:hypothetical protein
MSNQTRSSFKLDAGATAAALGSGTVPGPLNKIGQIAALAGFVLRLLRTKASEPERETQAPTKARPKLGQSSTKPRRQATSAAAPEKGGTGHGQG